MSYSGPIAANGSLWPNIAPKIRYQGRELRRHMQVRVKSVRNMGAFSAVGWCFHVADTCCPPVCRTRGRNVFTYRESQSTIVYSVPLMEIIDCNDFNIIFLFSDWAPDGFKPGLAPVQSKFDAV